MFNREEKVKGTFFLIVNCQVGANISYSGARAINLKTNRRVF